MALAMVAPISAGNCSSTAANTPVPTEYSVRVVAVAVAGLRLIPFSIRMTALFIALLASLRATIRSRLELVAEILALRHHCRVQVVVLFIIELSTRRVEIARITSEPDLSWMSQVTRNVTDVSDGCLRANAS
jgi:hypothetical protein